MTQPCISVKHVFTHYSRASCEVPTHFFVTNTTPQQHNVIKHKTMPRSCFVILIIIFEFGSSVSLTRVRSGKKKIFICPSYKKFALQLKTNNILHEDWGNGWANCLVRICAEFSCWFLYHVRSSSAFDPAVRDLRPNLTYHFQLYRVRSSVYTLLPLIIRR